MDSKRKTPAGKNSGLLHRFSQSVEKVLQLKGEQTPEPSFAANSSVKDPNGAPLSTDQGFPALWRQIEKILAIPEIAGGGRPLLLQKLLDYTGLTYAFITQFLHGDSKHFLISASIPKLSKFPGLHALQSVNSGLAGLIHNRLIHLAKPSLSSDVDISPIFYSGDPIKKPGSFYGWPLVFNDSPRGSLLLVGTKGQSLNPEQLDFISALALRLAALDQQSRLMDRVTELNRMDPQTGLPHRSDFLERLGQIMEVASVKGEGVRLDVLCISGLGQFSMAHGQANTRELLRAMAQQLLQYAPPEWDMGHISYGIFTLAVPASGSADADKTIETFKKRLSDWPFPNRSGRTNFMFHQATVNFPADGQTPEKLLESALIHLAAEE